MKKSLHILAAIMLTIIIFAFGCKKSDPENDVTDIVVEVTTLTPDNITDTEATCGAKVTADEEAELKELGICWSLAPNPTVSDSVRKTENCDMPFLCTLTGLTPETEYHVRAYVLNGSKVIYGLDESFTTLEAPFTAPEGAINGLFTINENGDQVYFSQGNLQYKASKRIWRFAEHQWDYVGDDTYGTVYENGVKSDNALTSPQYDGWIDLYCWGTSGYNHGAVCYQPWSSNYADPSHFYAYGNYDGNLNDQTGQADWGYNPIINGGNTENSWRTLTEAEWDYVLNTRSTPSGMRFAMATVNDINGAILLPDDWSDSCFVLANTSHYSSNIISAEQWVSLEEHGAVFLPAAGTHYGNEITHANEWGKYWSASCYVYTGYQYYYYYASHVEFVAPYIYCYFSCRNYGESVRLVKDADK